MSDPGSAGCPARRLLLDVYRAALEAVGGARLTREALDGLPLDRPVRLLAIGKAAGAMAEGARDRLGGSVAAALVVTRHGHAPAPEGLAAVSLEAGHPLPDQGSLAAGAAVRGFVSDSTPDADLLVLISGGTSALVEAPYPGLGLDDVRRAHRWLLGSGLAIDAMNAIRGRLSTIKHGGLLRALPPGVRAWQVLLSDVPGDLPEVIGSGPFLAPGREPPADDWIARLPAWLRRQVEASPSHPAPVSPAVQTRLIAGSTLARAAAVAAARAAGLRAEMHAEFMGGDAAAAGRRLAATVVARPGVVHVWSGETVVELPAQPGRGGRCQSLALAAATKLADHAGAALLAAGTDGADGPGGAAGALVDAGTVERGRAAGFDADDCLARADAGRPLDASGDLVVTGPTGTNVMDIMLGLRLDGSDANAGDLPGGKARAPEPR